MGEYCFIAQLFLTSYNINAFIYLSLDMEVMSVNLTHRKELRFPDLPDGDFEKNSRRNLSSVTLPREAFPSNTSGKYTLII